MVPTTRSPCDFQSSDAASAVVMAIANTGAALEAMSASRGRTPRATSIGLSRLRAKNRKATDAAPTASVSTWVSGKARAMEASSSTSVWPSARIPSSVLSWLAAINTADAVMKPLTTGWLRKLARKPSLRKPIASSIAPDSSARASAAPA
jgi:hypothetical protein